MVELLKAALPQGPTRQEKGVGGGNNPAASAQLMFDGGSGFAKVELVVRRLSTPVSKHVEGCNDRVYYPYEQCTDSKLANGARLVVTQGHANPTDQASVKIWSAVMTAREGMEIRVMERSPQKRIPGKSSYPDPPLTVRQLADISNAADWVAVSDPLPVSPPPPPPPFTPAIGKSQMLATVKLLLPSSVRTANESGSDQGYVTMTVNDGKGEALVVVTAQQWKPGDPMIQQVFEGSTAHSGGIRVSTRARPSVKKGGKEWDTDVLYPDGLRISVKEHNSTAFGLPLTRTTPALTVEQRAAIALSDAWKE